MARPRNLFSLSFRIVLLSIGLVTMVLGAIVFLSAYALERATHEQYIDQGRLASLVAARAVQTYSDLQDRQSMDRLIGSLIDQAEIPFYRISIYAEQEENLWVVVASSDEAVVGERLAERDLLRLATSDMESYEHVVEGIPIQEILSALHIAGHRAGLLSVSIDLTARDQLLRAQRWESIAIAVGGVGLLVLLLYGALLFLVVRPLGTLTRMSRRLAQGEYVLPPLSTRNDEVGDLTRAFVQMAQSLHLRERRLTALSEIGQAVNSLQQVEEIFRFLVERVRDLIPFRRFSIALLDEKRRSWSVAYYHGLEGALSRESHDIGCGLAGWTIRTGQGVVVSDLSQDERADSSAEEELIALGCHSAIVVPLGIEGVIEGTLNLVGEGVGAYDHSDLALLSLLGRQVETALQNARLLQRERRRAEQLRTLAEVSRQITSILDTDTLLYRVGEILQETFGYHRVNVGLIAGAELVFRARLGRPDEELRQIRVRVGEEGITGWVAQHGEPLLCNDVTQEPRYLSAPPSEGDRTLSELAVPIALGGEVMGILDVQSTERGAFAPEDLGLLQTLAGHLAVALDNARLYAEAQQRLQQQAALLETSASVTSTLRLEEVVFRVARAMVEAMDVTACAISTWNREANTVTLLAEHSVRGQGIEEGWGEEIGQPYLLEGYPATSSVLETGEPIVVNRGDPAADPTERALLAGYGLSSLLMLPLRARDQIIGLVELYDEERERSYSEQEIGFCLALANQAGLAAENARLYEDVRQERDAIELLYQVGQELSAALDMEEVLPKVLALAVEKTGAYRGSIIVLDVLGNPRHHILVREDLSPSVIRRLVQEVLRRGLAGWAVQHRRPALVIDTAEDPRWLELPETVKDVRSALVVPLVRGEALVGVLTLVHREPGYFRENHLELMTSVANQAAIAIDNARLFLDANRRVAQLNALLEINEGLSTDQPIQELLELVTFSAHGLLDASNTVLYLLEDDGQTLVPRVALGADSLTLREATLQVGEGLSGLVVQQRRSHILNEAHLTSTSKSLVRREDEPEALLSVPLMQGRVAVGALTVGRYGEGLQFGPADLEVTEILASQAVVALNNARLYREVQERADELASLNRIARTVGSTLELEEVFRQLIQELNRSFRVEAGSILLLEPATEELFFATTLEGGLERFLDVRLPVGVGIVGDVAKTGIPALVNDVTQDPRWYAKVSTDVGFVTRSTLCMPLISRDRVIGVIQLLNKENGDFDQQDQERLGSIAATVAVAIENAGLYEQTEEERGRLTAILTSTADAVIATDAQERILLINPAAARAFHLDPTEQVGQPFAQALPHEGLCRLFQRASRSEQPITDEIRAEEGTTFYVSISPVWGAGGQVLGRVAVMQDITTLKELDHMKTEFVGTVSHDLKTPLTAIRGYADLVKVSGGLSEQQAEFIYRIKEITAEMSDLISDLLDMGKIEAGIEMERLPCDLGGLAADVVSGLEFRAKEKQVSVALEVGTALPAVMGDPDRLKQVLMNLVGNAIKYTPRGGHIWIRVFSEDGRVVTCVQDDGIGISPRDQKQLFQKFYRVRSDATAHIEGTGLGLSIARSIVERHGGRIWVDSEIGRGSTFAFSLPVDAEEAQAAEVPRGTGSPEQPEGARQ